MLGAANHWLLLHLAWEYRLGLLAAAAAGVGVALWRPGAWGPWVVVGLMALWPTLRATLYIYRWSRLRQQGEEAERAGRLARAEGLYAASIQVLQRYAPDERLITRSGTTTMLGLSFFRLACLQRDQGRLEEAEHQFEAAESAYLLMGAMGVDGLVVVRSNLASVYRERGNPRRAREVMEAALGLYETERHLDPYVRGVLLQNLGDLHVEQGQKEEALARVEECIRLTRSVPLGTARRSELLGDCAGLLRALGRTERAEEVDRERGTLPPA